jgi:threonine synthase
MSIINTENPNEKTTFEESLLNSLPSFNGLWFPEKINKLPESFFINIETLSYHEIAFTVLKNITTFKISDDRLKAVIQKAFNFPVKLRELNEKIHILETFHGPTYTFKDFGARFLACYLEEYLSNSDVKYNVLVSTSGDTGSAIASAFYKIPNIKVTILYPKNRVSKIQEIQMTTYGGNIVSYCIENNFDQCQTMVKRAFVDKCIEINILSANSINLGRLIPQSIYYFYAYGLLKKKYGNSVINNTIFSVPCGNCGNLTGGLIAKQMGLPVKFIASQNKNSVFVDYLRSGFFSPILSNKTHSNAMDVGNPSNVKRIDYLYKSDISAMQNDIDHNICNEIQTMIEMKTVREKFGYIIDPHTAVAYNGIKNYKYTADKPYFIAISTASPVKFRYSVKKATGIFPKLTKDLELLTQKPNYSISLKNNYDTFVSNINKSFNTNCSITLIGMPGTGKTVVAYYINTKSTSYNLVELDNYIVSENNATLFQLIEKYGDDGFKQIEEDAILSIDFKYKKIISTGGSVIYSEKGMQYLQNNNNLIIYINTPFNILSNRTENFTNRGIVFNGQTPKELYNTRHKLYQKYADIEIESKNLTISNIGDIILQYFQVF